MPEMLDINLILTDGRIRGEMGDIDGLCNSIREFNLIQPIVLTTDTNGTRLVVGGRRLAALKRLGIKMLEHGVHYLYRGEENEYQRKAVELEENLRRQSLTWQEQVTAKQELLKLMQSLHGVAETGGRTRQETRDGVSDGFGVRKLASLLGESPAQTSKDLRIAGALKSLPQLAKADTKESAFRQLGILGAVASMIVNKVNAPAGEVQWTLFEGDFRDQISKVGDNSVDLIHSDLPFGVNLAQMSKHAGGVVGYKDTRDSVVSILSDIGRESFRILRPDRFAVFWFGFNFYGEIISSLEDAGFVVNRVPVIWFKNTRSTENPNTRYGNSYDPAIVAMKGSPVFIRPGQQNFVNLPPVTSMDRLQIAQQPVALVKKFIEDMVAPGATIVDFTAGSGTTGIAALECDCKVILFEKEPAACQLIKARLQSYQKGSGQKL